MDSDYFANRSRRLRAMLLGELAAIEPDHADVVKLGGGVVACDVCGHRASPDVCDAEGWEVIDGLDHCLSCLGSVHEPA